MGEATDKPLGARNLSRGDEVSQHYTAELTAGARPRRDSPQRRLPRAAKYIHLAMAAPVSPPTVRVGAVRGRYFRENFAQGGIDLVQIVPELVTNADAAIAAAGRERGRIELRFGAPDERFAQAWRAQMRALHVPALMSWRFEVRCADDGVGRRRRDGRPAARRPGRAARAARQPRPVRARAARRVARAGRGPDRGCARRPRGGVVVLPVGARRPVRLRPRARRAGARSAVRHARDGAARRRAAAGGRPPAHARLPARAAAPGAGGPGSRAVAGAAFRRDRARARTGAGTGSRAARPVRRRGPGRAERARAR